MIPTGQIHEGDRLLIRLRMPDPMPKHAEPWADGTVESFGFVRSEPAVRFTSGQVIILDEIESLENLGPQ